MIELPRHVHRVVARGREYYYFQRNRGTADEGERHRLPSDPASKAFWTEYDRLSGHAAASAGTFKALIEEYKASPEYAEKSADTRRGYDRYLDIIEEAWGHLPVNGLVAKNVLRLRDSFADRPATANGLIRMVSVLINYGIPREYRADNPCQAIGKLKTGEYDPWPDWAIEAGRQAPAHLVRVLETALYTGQRQGDCLGARWSDIEDGGIWVRQDKTNKKLWIPLHTEYKAALAAFPRHGPFIHTNNRKRPWTSDGFRASWRKYFATVPEIVDNRLVFHGLRKTACAKLAEAGCTSEEIQAITGQSLQMVEHYTKGANQKRMAKAAILKLERGNSG